MLAGGLMLIYPVAIADAAGIALIAASVLSQRLRKDIRRCEVEASSEG